MGLTWLEEYRLWEPMLYYCVEKEDEKQILEPMIFGGYKCAGRRTFMLKQKQLGAQTGRTLCDERGEDGRKSGETHHHIVVKAVSFFSGLNKP